MTLIADYPSKKAFKEAVMIDPEQVFVTDPSFFFPLAGTIPYVLNMNENKEFTVTNHPRRSWFARVYINKNGIIKVD